MFLRQLGIQREVGHPQDAVHRSADFVAHVGQKSTLGAVGVLGCLPQLCRLLKLLPDSMSLLLDSFPQHEPPGQDRKRERGRYAQHRDGMGRGPPRRTLDDDNIL